MAHLPTKLISEESRREIAIAVADWRKLTAADGEVTRWRAAPRYWNEAHGYWAFFGRTKANTSLGWRYWNAFGVRLGDIKDTMAVEINPPQAGIAQGTQGLFARDSDGERWILHGGRLHIGRKRLASEEFAQLSSLSRIPVFFSDGSKRYYFLVAPLDRGSGALHAGLRSFAAACASARNRVLYGDEDAVLEDRIDVGEGQSSQEKRGDYMIPPRPPVIAKRIHADIWHALVKTLDKLKIEHTNARVGRWGPDLRTRGAVPILFEIKTDTSARAIYEALGQLILYEQLVGKDHRKVLVVPGVVSTTFIAILAAMKISILEACPAERSYAFPALNQLLGEHKGATPRS